MWLGPRTGQHPSSPVVIRPVAEALIDCLKSAIIRGPEHKADQSGE